MNNHKIKDLAYTGDIFFQDILRANFTHPYELFSLKKSQLPIHFGLKNIKSI